MVRIRIGEGWASDAGVRAGLRAAAGAARRAAVRAIVDVVAVEVEGVDIGAGRTEGPLAEGVLGMLRAVDRLASGEEHASVPFEDGAVELVLHRRGGAALLSVATLSRPARLLAHDVEVDLPRLAEAAREAALAFCHRVAEIAPGARALPELRDLLRAAGRPRPLSPPRPSALPGERSRRTRRKRDAACSFEIHDEDGRLSTWRGSGADLASLLVRGRVSFRSPAGQEILSLAGAPYLLLRDLCAAAARIASAPGAPIAFDLARPGRRATARVSVVDGTVAIDGGAPVRCDSLAFAQAVLEGTADFCSVVRGRAPAQGANSLLCDLERSAAHALAQVLELREGDRIGSGRRRIRVVRERSPRHPLAPGRLRRVSFHRIASIEVGPPAGSGLFLLGNRLVAAGRERTLSLDPCTGSVGWRGPGAQAAAADERLVVTLAGASLQAHDPSTGERLWASEVSLDPGARSSLALGPGRRVLVTAGPALSALDPASGATLWTFTSAGASRLWVLSLGPLLLAASDAGMVHALDLDGRVTWRLRGPGPLAAPPDASARACLLVFQTPAGATLDAVDPSTGARLFEASLDFTPVGAPCRFAGRIAIAGRVAGDGVVAAIEEDGTAAWTEPSPTGAPPALAGRPGGLLAKSADGTCAALDRDGRTSWLRACDGRPAPPGNLPPVAVRGLVVVASEEVDLLDGQDGAPVGRVPAHAPARLAIAPDLTTWTLDGEGLLCGSRVRGHLAVVEPPPARRP